MFWVYENHEAFPVATLHRDLYGGLVDLTVAKPQNAWGCYTKVPPLPWEGYFLSAQELDMKCYLYKFDVDIVSLRMAISVLFR